MFSWAFSTSFSGLVTSGSCTRRLSGSLGDRLGRSRRRSNAGRGKRGKSDSLEVSW